MEINVHDDNKEVNFSYGNWKSMREIIVKISFFHLESILNNPKNKGHKLHEKIMRNLIKSMFGQKLEPDTNLSELVTVYMHNSFNLDALIYYEMGGLYALCNKRDNEGYYTPGNSLDICNLLDEIEESVKSYNASLYDAIYGENKDSIYNYFKSSCENNMNIMIKR